jgi:exonuclease III
MIYHQNIRGLKGKINELLLTLSTTAPHLICFTEHHLKEYEMAITHFPNYTLEANYCRKSLKQGGVCIYVHESIKFSNINLLKYNKEQDIEIAAIQLSIHRKKAIILCIYRAPCGNFEYFLNKLEIILNSLYKLNTEFIICGDININYLEPNYKKNQLDNLLATYNLTDTVYFPTRIINNSATLIDNIFIDNRRSYTIQRCLNGLSDHDGQILSLPNLIIPSNNATYMHTRRFNDNAVADFQLQLSYEQWDDVFDNNNVNEIFNNFLNTYLRCYYASFTKKEQLKQNLNSTSG